MGIFNSFTIKVPHDEEKTRIALDLSAQLRSSGWTQIVEGCGDVILVFNGEDVGECEDFSLIFKINDNIEWLIVELGRLKTL